MSNNYVFLIQIFCTVLWCFTIFGLFPIFFSAEKCMYFLQFYSIYKKLLHLHKPGVGVGLKLLYKMVTFCHHLITINKTFCITNENYKQPKNVDLGNLRFTKIKGEF